MTLLPPVKPIYVDCCKRAPCIPTVVIYSLLNPHCGIIASPILTHRHSGIGNVLDLFGNRAQAVDRQLRNTIIYDDDQEFRAHLRLFLFAINRFYP